METFEEEIDVEGWACAEEDRALPNAQNYKVRLWSGDGFDEKRRISDASPTGEKILLAFDLLPADEYALFLLDRDGLHVISLEETIEIGSRRAERFFAFKTDRIYYFSINGVRFPWGAPSISEQLLRLIGRIHETKQIVLELSEQPDKVLEEEDIVQLNIEGLERLVTRTRSWKLKVQGVVLIFTQPNVIVRDALIKAGIDPDSGWTAAIKFKGAPREAIGLNETIDLTRQGIEKLWLWPNHINNGEQETTLKQAFSIREEDKHYLKSRDFKWETLIDNGRRWFILYDYELPKGYNSSVVDLAIEIPPTYPAAKLDMFYCLPHLKKNDGTTIPKTETNQIIKDRSFQRWSRHREGDTKWNPAHDSIITHIAIIEESIAREVGL